MSKRIKQKETILRRRIHILSGAWCINSLAYSIVYPFLPIYLHSIRGLPMTQVGLIFPIMGAGIIIGPPISGYLADRFGRRILLGLGPLGRGLVFVILSVLAFYSAPFWCFAIALFASASLGTFFQNASDAYLTDITTSEKRIRAYAKIRVGTNIGWAVGPMLGAFLSRTPFSAIFAVTALLCMSGAFLAYRGCPEIKRPASGINRTQNKIPEKRIRWLKYPRFVILLLSGFFLFLLVSQLFSTFSIYATEVAKISKNSLGIIYSMNGLTIIFFQIPVSRWLAKQGQYTNLILGSVFYVIGFLLIPLGTNMYYFMLAVVIITMGEVIIQPSLYSSISFLSPEGAVGRFMGVLGLTRGIGYAIGPFLGSILFSVWGKTPFLLWGTCSIAGLIAIVGFSVCGLISRKVNP